MVKADLSRDYYGDLELPPNADLNDIKKQFKKLALTYHPDRNPGRESEVTAKFQKIQSAHEVLIDAQERAKYDAGRGRGNNGYRSSFATSTPNPRGNPYSNAGSQWAPPPKPPTARKPPPASAGAQRYKNFEAPKTSANQAAQEGAEARKSTYEAWENMRNHKTSERTEGSRPVPDRPVPDRPVPDKPDGVRPGPGRTWKAPQAPPKEFTPQSGREESNSFKHAPPPKVKPGYDEFRSAKSYGTSPLRRSHSTSASSRKGFMPNTPGGDEPAAPKGAYFTQRNKPQEPPGPPNGGAPQFADPLKQFRESTDQYFEPRLSSPYATHGGEKLNPFESANLNRSTNASQQPEIPESTHRVPRTGSDPNLASPHRTRSYANHSKKASKGYAVPNLGADSSSSDDDGPEISQPTPRPRVFTQSKSNTAAASTGDQRIPDSNPGPESTRKPNLVSEFRKWHAANSSADLPLNGSPPDGPPGGSSQANREASGEPTMYASFENLSVFNKGHSTHHNKSPTVSEVPPSNDSYFASFPDSNALEELYSIKWPHVFSNLANSPSGVSTQRLNAFEGMQRTLLDKLLLAKKDQARDPPPQESRNGRTNNAPQVMPQSYSQRRRAASYNHSSLTDCSSSESQNTAEMGSPSKLQRSAHSISSDHSYWPETSHSLWAPTEQAIADANYNNDNRFSFKTDDETFTRTRPRPNAFMSNSAENISMKFTPEDWDGKFEAGGDYFQPAQKAANGSHRPRAMSTSRSRGRSPVKARPFTDPDVVQPQVNKSPVESPSTTKFSPEEWAQSFQPQTFAPPPNPTQPRNPSLPPRTPGRKVRGSVARPTMGTTTVPNEGGSGDGSSLSGQKSSTPMANPDPMDVDSPPVMQMPTTPGISKTSNEQLKRAANPSQSPIESAALKVNFEDLKIQDIISSLNLPRPPKILKTPQAASGFELPIRAAHEAYLSKFKEYMCDWDRFNSQILHYMVARKNQNDATGANRWLDDMGLDTYRRCLKEDEMVMSYWIDAGKEHQKALKDFAIAKEGMRIREEMARPRKKTHGP